MHLVCSWFLSVNVPLLSSTLGTMIVSINLSGKWPCIIALLNNIVGITCNLSLAYIKCSLHSMSAPGDLLKDSELLRNLYCFFSFGIILFILFFFYRTGLCPQQISETATPSVTKLHTTCSAPDIFEPIRITILDLEPNPCFHIFLNISETNDRIFNCNISNRRSSQVLPSIFFELKALTCLWGRYDPKPENFTLFGIYLLHIHSLSKTLYTLVWSYPSATFHVLVAKVYIVTGAHYIT